MWLTVEFPATNNSGLVTKMRVLTNVSVVLLRGATRCTSLLQIILSQSVSVVTWFFLLFIL